MHLYDCYTHSICPAEPSVYLRTQGDSGWWLVLGDACLLCGSCAIAS
jgi:hypothetical protein